jgi:uncharacterized membrane protein HdeD (DUF308 family)
MDTKDTQDSERTRSQKLHQESQRQYDREQNALCFVVLGTISLIIGILFIFLAYRRENNVMTHIDVNSLAFVICVIALAVGMASLIYGLIKFFRALHERKRILREINTLSK